MKKEIFIYIFIVFIFNINLFADSLTEALLKAYNKNPKLNAERENINISKKLHFTGGKNGKISLD